MSTLPPYPRTSGTASPGGVADPAQLPEAFARAFNAGDLAAVDQLFEPEALRVLRPGTVVTGDGRRAATAGFMAKDVPIELEPRHVYAYEDLALIIGDFRIVGTTPDGSPVHEVGTATDVARRGPDGRWRYVIDNPPGVARS